MSFRSMLTAALSGIATAFKFAGKAARAVGRGVRFTANAAATPVVWAARVVIDTATGVARIVHEIVRPSVPVMPVQAQAEAYLDAGEAAAPAPDLSAFRAQHPELVEQFGEREYPEAALVRAAARHRALGGSTPAVDESVLPEHVRLWLDSLGHDGLARVGQASPVILDRHLRAQCEADLMRGLPQVLPLDEARAARDAARSRAAADIAARAGARVPGSRRGGDFAQADLDALVAATEEAGPSPTPFR